MIEKHAIKNNSFIKTKWTKKIDQIAYSPAKQIPNFTSLQVWDLLDLTMRWALLQLNPIVFAARQMYIPPSASVTWWITNLLRYVPSDPLPISLDFRMMKGCLLITIVLLDLNLGSSTRFSHCKQTQNILVPFIWESVYLAKHGFFFT